MVLPAPLSTLFPYTTLFRSRPPSPWPSEAEPALGRAAYRHLGAVRGWTPIRSWAAAPTHTTTDQHDDRQDRKSTRLNSSHVAISYAVFCLKKKNTNKEAFRC